MTLFENERNGKYQTNLSNHGSQLRSHLQGESGSLSHRQSRLPRQVPDFLVLKNRIET